MSHTAAKHNNYPCLYIYILGKEGAAREPISYPSFQNKIFESRWPKSILEKLLKTVSYVI